MRTSIKTNLVGIVIGLMLPFACVKDGNFDIPSSDCSEELVSNATFAELKGLYSDETIQIQEDLIIEGYVISSDEKGNFFNELYIQDNSSNATSGLQIEIEMTNSHLLYPVGSKVFIKLRNLYLGKSKGVFKLGGVFSAFGNESVGRLPATQVAEHIVKSCDDLSILQPHQIETSSLNEALTNTLVQLNNVEFKELELGQSFANALGVTERILVDCDQNEIILLNSGFADFQEALLPELNGTITGVLLRENSKYHLVIRGLEDLDFSQERCTFTQEVATSKAIFISELADPDNNSKARFVELYNSSTSSMSLEGWSLRRYTNENTEVGSTIDLSPLTLLGEGAIVISPNAGEFETVYGFAPDLVVGTNGPADSNGDDTLELVDPFGEVVDVFGIIGEDGSGTNHEFEDGRAIRNASITQGNSNYTFSEWTIYNDTGSEGTIQNPQMAPEDFTPKVRD